MIEFYSISTFRKSIGKMLKVRREVYSGIEESVKSVFKGRSIEEIRTNRDIVLMRNDSVIIKLRVPDVKSQKSRSDGFRLIYLTYKDIPKVILMDIFPKRGPLQKLNISEKEFKELIRVTDEEAVQSILEPYSIDSPK